MEIKSAEDGFADMSAAALHTLIRENEEAEIVAARALELSEKHKIASVAAVSRRLLAEAADFNIEVVAQEAITAKS